MDLTRTVGVLAVLTTVVGVVGALFSFFARLLTGSYVIPVILALLLLSASIAASVGTGVLSSRFLSNPYW